MAQYIVYAQGNRGLVSRVGSKNSGANTIANGWNTGCAVVIKHENKKDHVYVYKTKGTNGRGEKTLVADWFED